MYRPDFYIVPAIIADDERVPPKGEKLYGVIYWLYQLKGKCFASNETLAQLVGKKTNPTTVANLLKKLEDCGYITRTFEDCVKTIRGEIIPLVRFKVNGVSPNDEPTSSNGEPVGSSNGEQKYNNNTEYIYIGNDKSLLPGKLGNTPLVRLSKFYSGLFREEFGDDVKPKIQLHSKDGGVLKSLLKNYTEMQIAAMMIAYFNPEMDFEMEKLRREAFPLSWLSSSANKLIVYLSENEDVEFSSIDAVRDYVEEYVSGMNLSTK